MVRIRNFSAKNHTIINISFKRILFIPVLDQEVIRFCYLLRSHEIPSNSCRVVDNAEEIACRSDCRNLYNEYILIQTR